MTGRPKHPREFDRRFWAGVRAGLGVEAAAVVAGMSETWGRSTFRKAGGVNPTRAAGPVGRYLSWSEREEIAALDHAGHGVCEIARRLDRNPGTISRELDRGATRRGYRASVGQAKADESRTAPRAAKLATNLRLRREVQARLTRRESPEQIAGRLKIDFPDEPEMWVSAETIYQSLYVQARGGLRRELTAYLRTGRSMRKPRRREGERRGRIPGHGLDQRTAARGRGPGRPRTLGRRPDHGLDGVELRGRHPGRTHHRVRDAAAPARPATARLAVQEALVDKMATLPEQLLLSLTWDQGREMANHLQIADATGLEIYFCDPHSPWQRGSNENTNGLLRQYLPKGTDLSFYGPGMLDNIAAELNSRPRKRHAFQTPAEVLEQLLSKAATNHGVA